MPVDSSKHASINSSDLRDLSARLARLRLEERKLPKATIRVLNNQTGLRGKYLNFLPISFDDYAYAYAA